jgi:diaminopimelate decarboxylase
MRDTDAVLRAAAELLHKQTPILDARELASFVGSFLNRRDDFLQACREHGSPLYVFEHEVLLQRAERFAAAFRAELPSVRVYYALKSNHHPLVAGTLVKAGLGLDVSSGEELKIALDCGAADIIFSGPGKTEDELKLATSHTDRVTVLIDSFGELDKLERAAAGDGVRVRAGVRLTNDERGLWRKFGIPLSQLERFFSTARQCNHVDLRGLQFHSSWNLDPDNQVAFISRLGTQLRALDVSCRSAIEFIDIGGGFWPQQGEWLQSSGTPEGRLEQAVFVHTRPDLTHHRCPSAPIETFAREIGRAVRAEILTHIDCSICMEPGRWLCHDAMHILLTVIDRKADDLVITDGGTNAVGWERFETDYFPVINLSRPGSAEHECYVLGSLCTPHDVWGYGYWGEGIEPGDVLLIPTQGAYTYSLRQNFIKPLPKAVVLDAATRE